MTYLEPKLWLTKLVLIHEKRVVNYLLPFFYVLNISYYYSYALSSSSSANCAFLAVFSSLTTIATILKLLTM